MNIDNFTSFGPRSERRKLADSEDYLLELVGAKHHATPYSSGCLEYNTPKDKKLISLIVGGNHISTVILHDVFGCVESNSKDQLHYVVENWLKNFTGWLLPMRGIRNRILVSTILCEALKLIQNNDESRSTCIGCNWLPGEDGSQGHVVFKLTRRNVSQVIELEANWHAGLSVGSIHFVEE